MKIYHNIHQHVFQSLINLSKIIFQKYASSCILMILLLLPYLAHNHQIWCSNLIFNYSPFMLWDLSPSMEKVEGKS